MSAGADRLYRLLAFLRRRRRPVTARTLAEHLEVSVRTVYRDIRDLVANDVPIRGEAGVGYVLDRGTELPPVTFDAEEIQALVFGARLSERFTDPALRAASRSALDKLAAVLPSGARHIDGTPLYAIPSPFLAGTDRPAALGMLREAVVGRKAVTLTYTSDAGATTRRTVCPLGLWFWGRTWTVAGWCELREGYRNFRVDRIDDPVVEDRTFPDAPPTTMDAYMAHIREEG
ncbi:MAG: YafY family protein [Myxococcota bacterium]